MKGVVVRTLRKQLLSLATLLAWEEFADPVPCEYVATMLAAICGRLDKSWGVRMTVTQHAKGDRVEADACSDRGVELAMVEYVVCRTSTLAGKKQNRVRVVLSNESRQRELNMCRRILSSDVQDAVDDAVVVTTWKQWTVFKRALDGIQQSTPVNAGVEGIAIPSTDALQDIADLIFGVLYDCLS